MPRRGLAFGCKRRVQQQVETDTRREILLTVEAAVTRAAPEANQQGEVARTVTTAAPRIAIVVEGHVVWNEDTRTDKGRCKYAPHLEIFVLLDSGCPGLLAASFLGEAAAEPPIKGDEFILCIYVWATDLALLRDGYGAPAMVESMSVDSLATRLNKVDKKDMWKRVVGKLPAGGTCPTQGFDTDKSLSVKFNDEDAIHLYAPKGLQSNVRDSGRGYDTFGTVPRMSNMCVHIEGLPSAHLRSPMPPKLTTYFKWS